MKTAPRVTNGSSAGPNLSNTAYSAARGPTRAPGPEPDQPAAARDNGTKIRHFSWTDHRSREIARFADLNLNPRLPASAGPRNGRFLAHVT